MDGIYVIWEREENRFRAVHPNHFDEGIGETEEKARADFVSQLVASQYRKNGNFTTGVPKSFRLKRRTGRYLKELSEHYGFSEARFIDLMCCYFMGITFPKVD